MLLSKLMFMEPAMCLKAVGFGSKLTLGPGGPTRPAAPGKPVAP